MNKLLIIVCTFCVCMCSGFSIKTDPQKSTRRVCVIGAGIAGLTSSKYLKEEGLNFTVLEATKYVGGTWRYDPRTGRDENGLPLYTSMYKHLRTNLPKQTMELRGYPLPKDMPSFPSWRLYYEYLKGYAKRFELEKHIKFEHYVVSVRRVSDVWRVRHMHMPTKEIFEEEFDFVIVGTGHYSKPKIPDIPGEELFKGTIIHSHDYREPEPYKDRRVLVVGAGPSGMDIGLAVADVSRTLVHSHHLSVNFRTKFPPNYIKKSDVVRLNETGAVFKDGSFEEIDDIIYCTGYEYDYPFLDDSCGLTLSKTSVIPLYRYMVNIHQPTMVVMGLIVRACVVIALDAQARYATALAKGNFTLPPKEQMLDEWQKRADAVSSRGRPLSDIHLLDRNEDQYYADLTQESGIDRVPPVMFKIRQSDTAAKLQDLYTYRNYAYDIIDSETFSKRLETEELINNNISNTI